MFNKFLYLGILSTSFFQNYKFYNENANLKKEKSEMFKICKNAMNDKIYYINKIKKS